MASRTTTSDRFAVHLPFHPSFYPSEPGYFLDIPVLGCFFFDGAVILFCLEKSKSNEWITLTDNNTSKNNQKNR